MDNQQPDAQGEAAASRRDDATVKPSDKTVVAGDKRGPKPTVKDSPGAASNETVPGGETPVDPGKVTPTAFFDPATAHTMDFQHSAEESVVYEVRPLKKPLPKSIGVYDIRRELGRGGMGVVYLARHRVLDRDVALKMVLDAAHADADQLMRFTTEARAVAHLQHPNIVQIFEVGEHDGLPFFSLEYVNGLSLKEKQGGKPLAPEEAAQIVEKLARAMQYAHDHQILHRDLKPANVLMTGAGVPKISDFGLAKRLTDDGDSASTRTGTVMGTPSYMSPEQARGDVKFLSPATDQYSLGAVLYELLTGRPPFLASRPVDTILQVLQEEPIPPRRSQPTLPSDIETICLKALQKEPFKRYVDCAAFADDLRRYLVGEPIRARPIGAIERTKRWCLRNPKIATLSFTSVGLLIALVIILSVSRANYARQNREIAKTNQDLKASNIYAESQRKLAEHKAEEAKRNQQEAEDQKKIAQQEAKTAGEQAMLAIQTIQYLIREVQSKLSEAPATQALKKGILDLANSNISKVADKIDPNVTSYEATELALHKSFGDVYKELGETKKAHDHYVHFHRIAVERLRIQNASNASRTNLCIALRSLGLIKQELDRDMRTSLHYLDEALRWRTDLMENPKPPQGEETPPSPTALQYEIAQDNTLVGTTHYRLGDPGKARIFFEKALALRLDLLNSTDKLQELAMLLKVPAAVMQGSMKQNVAVAHLALAETSFRLGDHDSALKGYEQGLEIQRALFEKNPANVGLQHLLSQTLGNYGDLLLNHGDIDRARQQYDESLKLVEGAASLDPYKADYQRSLGLSYYRLGNAARRANELAKAQEHYAKSREIRQKLVDREPKNDRRQMELMLALAHCGEITPAAELASRFRQSPLADNELLVDVARAYAQCSTSAKESSQQDEFVRLALDALRLAVEQGYKDVVYLQSEPDLEVLQTQTEFLKLLEPLKVTTPMT